MCALMSARNRERKSETTSQREKGCEGSGEPERQRERVHQKASNGERVIEGEKDRDSERTLAGIAVFTCRFPRLILKRATYACQTSVFCACVYVQVNG